MFDRTGQADDSPNRHPHKPYGSFNRHDFDTFDAYFTGADGQRVRYSFTASDYFRKHSITNRAYHNSILPQSFTRPYLLVFYGDMCAPCDQIQDLVRKIVAELEPIGVGFATVHSRHESGLAKRIGVHTLPHIISLADGDVRPYLDEEVSLSTFIEFIRRTLPKNLIAEVNDNNYRDFLSGWNDNKVRVLFVNEDGATIKLRYLLVAFYFRERIAFGRVLIDHSSHRFRQHYYVDPKMNSMLVFNEDISRPTATLSVSELKTQLMKDVLDSNKYLLLPRVTSQVCNLSNVCILQI